MKATNYKGTIITEGFYNKEGDIIAKDIFTIEHSIKLNGVKIYTLCKNNIPQMEGKTMEYCLEWFNKKYPGIKK